MILSDTPAGVEALTNKWFSRADKLRDWLATHVVGFGFLLLALFLAGAVARDIQRPIWYDEIFTRKIAMLDTASIWLALKQSAENQPYPFYLLTHYSQKLFGDNSLAIRFPETIGFACMGICIFLFMRRRAEPLCALGAAALPVSSGILYYASEGRPYGLVVGFCGLILVCWQAAAEGRNRRWAVAGLALSVAGAISSHYLAGLMLIPIGLAELIRIRQNRRLDLPVYCAILAGLTPLLALLPQLAAMRVYKDGFWAQPSPQLLWDCFEFSGGLACIAGALLCIRPLARLRSRTESAPLADPPLPLHEVVAAAGLFLSPLFLFAAARFTGAFFPRYVLETVVGSSILCGVGIDRFSRRYPAIGLLFLISVTGILAFQTAWTQIFRRMGNRPPMTALMRSAVRSPYPLVVTGTHFFLEEHELGDASFSSHMWYIADTTQAKRFGVPPSDDLALLMLSRQVKIPVARLDDFLSAHPSFDLMDVDGTLSWQLRYLYEAGARIQLQAIDQSMRIYHIETNPN